MPIECKISCANKNLNKIILFLPLTLLLGVVELLLALNHPNYISDPLYQKRALLYSFCLITFSIVFFIWCFLTRYKIKDENYKLKNIPIYVIITFIQMLLFYNFFVSFSTKTSGGYGGYSAWTTGVIIIITLLAINPIYFSTLLLLQGLAIIIFEPLFRYINLISFTILIVAFALLNYTRWLIKKY